MRDFGRIYRDGAFCAALGVCLLKTVEHKGSKSVFGNKEIVYFGYSRDLSGAMNMALDESLLRRADLEDRFFLRFYEVGKPTVILSNSDNYDSAVKSSGLDVEVCRRMTGGRPIYLDSNTLEYSICGPLRKEDSLESAFGTPVKIHKSLGPILADAISEMIGDGNRISFGNTSSIRIANKPIAGHAQMIAPSHSFLYHGVIVIYPWNLKVIDSVLNLPRDDIKEISTLPCIHSLARKEVNTQYKEGLVQNMLGRMAEENLSYASDAEKAAILKDAQELFAAKYGTREWTLKDVPKHGVRFCLLES